MKINDALSGAVLVVLAAVILWHIRGFPEMPGQKFGPAWFPGLIAIGLAACGLLLVVSGARSGVPWLALPPWLSHPRPAFGAAAVLGGLAFYILAADWLGFHLTGIIVMLLWVRALGASWRMAIAVSVIATFAIHLAFYKALRVPLPWGLLERWAF